MNNVVFFMGRRGLVVQNLFIVEASRFLSDTPNLVKRLWRCDHTDAETYTWQQTTLKRHRHPCPRRDLNPQSQQASGRKLLSCAARPLGTDELGTWNNSNNSMLATWLTCSALLLQPARQWRVTLKSRSIEWSAYGRVSMKPARIWNITYEPTSRLCQVNEFCTWLVKY
jgi:hypothetical protein